MLGAGAPSTADLNVVQTYDRIQAAFPSEGSAEMVVVKADDGRRRPWRGRSHR